MDELQNLNLSMADIITSKNKHNRWKIDIMKTQRFIPQGFYEAEITKNKSYFFSIAIRSCRP